MKKIIILISLGISLVFLVSCAGRYTALEKNRGRAFETAKYRQTVNPDAQSQEIVEGTPGLAGDTAMNNYYDSFTKQKRTNDNFVNTVRFKVDRTVRFAGD